MKINPLVKTSRNILILYQFQYNYTTDALSTKPSIAFCVLSRSLSFNRSSLIIFIIISSEDSLNFSLMVVVVVFNLSPLCIEKYFLSWHLLSWCLQNVNPFLLVYVPGYVLESNSVTAVFLCCVIYAFPKALPPSLARAREKAFSSHSQSSCECGGCESYCWLRGEIVLLWKNVSALMWFPNCY